MFRMKICVVSVALALSGAAHAQQADDTEIDCELESNREDPACLGLPDTGQPITNFAPLAGIVGGLGALAGLAGGGSSDGTTSTTSTTSTTN